MTSSQFLRLIPVETLKISPKGRLEEADYSKAIRKFKKMPEERKKEENCLEKTIKERALIPVVSKVDSRMKSRTPEIFQWQQIAEVDKARSRSRRAGKNRNENRTTQKKSEKNR